MKRFSLFLIAVVTLAFASCSNRDAEKRIAELESRLAELETHNTPARPVNTPAEPEVKPEGPLPEFTFEKTEHDFGTIKEGEVVEHVFKFTNTGEAPLIIQNATGSCGCTVPTYSKEPISPGETGEIVAKFDSKGRLNTQNKSVTVTANTWPKQTILRIRSTVVPGEENAAGPVRQK